MRFIRALLGLLTTLQLGYGAVNPSPLYTPPKKPSYRYGHAPTPDAYTRSMWCGSTEFGAEALFWRREEGDFLYALTSEGGIAMLRGVRPNYEWDYRVYLGYHLPMGWGARITYTRFYDSFSGRVEGGISLFGGDPLNGATGKVYQRYQAVDAEVIASLCCSRYASLLAFGGARWLRLALDEQYHYERTVGPLLTVQQRGKFTGTGPRFGLRGVLTPIPCGCMNNFEVAGQVAISGPIGSRRSRFVATEPIVAMGNVGLTYPSRTQVIPGLEMKVGAAYAFRWMANSWTLYIDYEQQVYLDADRRAGALSESGLPMTNAPLLTLSGVNFGFRLRY
ncbi:MAG: Lpg1974 family pore-forming outer membrane protein [Parachlamydiales bacterium]